MGFADLLADDKTAARATGPIACDVEDQQAVRPTFPFTSYSCELVGPPQPMTTPHDAARYQVVDG